ncbi:MAG: ornithine carbamoyltransferase [Thermoplasmata archaeon]
MKKDVISVLDMEDYLLELIDEAITLKAKLRNREVLEPLKNRSIAMIFEKPSTRTRVSFEVGITQLGGHALYLSPKDLQLGRGETIADTAKVLSRYVDAIVYRAFEHKMVLELAKNATVPVINALDDLEHPCQCAADLMTIKEKKGEFKGLKFVYVGDGNNVCNSLLLGSAIVGMNMVACCPKGYHPDRKIFETAKKIAKKNGARIEIMEEPEKAVKDADVIYTDVWVSMGDEAEKEKREKVFQPYQVNMKLLKKAKKDCIFMHCLPAHRGYEVTDEVIDSEQSVVFDEAENRLHVQKAMLLRLIEH